MLGKNGFAAKIVKIAGFLKGDKVEKSLNR
jgi:hypothetical protein